jgi:hypothetical protein
VNPDFQQPARRASSQRPAAGTHCGPDDGDPLGKFQIHTPHFDKEQKAGEGINLSALAVRERSVTLFFILAAIIAGAFAYFNLGRAEDPIFTIKVFTVTAAWPGATAQEMQDLVAEPLEKRMQELTYYDHVDTFTRAWSCVSYR